jgi:malate dehydrogenase
MITSTINVTVTGAAGQIGYALLYRLASGQVFGTDTRVNLNLLEIERALPALEGVVMELTDCAFPTLGQVIVTADVNVAMKDANYAVLVGSVPRKDGMERSDLLKINGGIFAPQGKAINDHAAGDVKVLVVGNPCNTNCLIAMNNAPDIPNNRFFAMTYLDQNRAYSQLAEKAKVDVTAIENMIIWGNHSATQYPDFYNARINGKPLLEVINDENWLQNEFIPLVQKRGAAIIKARGASSAASAANGIIDSLKALHFDSSKVYSMCCCSNGEYGVDPGLIYSFPCRTVEGKVVIVPDFVHDSAFAKEKLEATLAELRQERDTVKSLELIGA